MTSRVSTVTITLEVSNENPTLHDVAEFISEAREHGAGIDAIVDVTHDYLRVTLP